MNKTVRLLWPVLPKFPKNSHRCFFDKADRDWDKAWQMGLTPWDLKGTVVPALKQTVEEKEIITPSNFHNVLIPGCGSGYECLYMKEKGFSSVTGLDLSSTAINRARQLAATKQSSVCFEVADFFTYQGNKPYDFIFDYLFFSALEPSIRHKWAKSMSNLLLPKRGILATLIFPLKEPNHSQDGPPFPVSLDDYKEQLHPAGFEIIQILQVCHLFSFEGEIIF